MQSYKRTAREMTVQRPFDTTTPRPAATVATTLAKLSTRISTARRASATSTSTSTATPSTSTATGTSTITATATRDSMASARPEAANPATASTTTPSTTSSANPQDNYFKFTEKHEQFLVKQARRHASTLVVDALYDPSKWQFIGELKATSTLNDNVAARPGADASGSRKRMTPAQQPLEVFELRDAAINRVACVAPRLAADPQRLAQRSHTLLARTRVRGKLDDFMRWMTTSRRAVYQGMMNTLHEGHLQHSDVFSGFDTENPQRERALEQFALKYFIVEPTAPGAAVDTMRTSTSSSSTSSSATPTTTATTTPAKGGPLRKLNFLRRKLSMDSQDPTHLQQEHAAVTAQQQTSTTSSTSSSSSKAAEGRMHFCVGEYTTVRPGIMRPDCPPNAAIADPRIGIISYHSVEDPELLKLCNSIAKRTTARDVRRCTSRTLMQYSGIVAYPVVSADDDGADYLEVVIKVSCFDARGLSTQKRATMLSFIAGFRNLAHTMLVMRLRSSPFLTTDRWVADEHRKCCLVCQQRFSSLRRRHHCRLCGEVTCAKCCAVHQVRLVKEAKASLRICVLCVQGKEPPKGTALEGMVQAVQQEQESQHRQTMYEPPVHRETFSHVQGESVEETEPTDLLDFSFVDDLAKPVSQAVTMPPSPTSTLSNSSCSHNDPLLHSRGKTVSISSTESEGNLDNTIRDFHDSAFHLPAKAVHTFGHMKRHPFSEDLVSLHESSIASDDELEEEEEEPESDLEPQHELLRSVSLVTDFVEGIRAYVNPEVDFDDEPVSNSIRRISALGDDDDEESEDEDDARLQALAPYGLLDTNNLVDGVMPENLVLQKIVKEAAQMMDCGIAAIGFVDASRDMVSAAYSASPLCQVARGVLPKQYSLTWDVMERCHASKKQHDMPATTSAATLSPTHVVILDATKDETLKRNPFVVATPFVRFMVGIPIRALNGVVIGALMVADVQSRSEVSADQLLQLKGHTTLVEAWLENKRDEIASSRAVARGTKNRAVDLHERLAEMLHTTNKTNLELQMRGMQMKQQGATTQQTTKTTNGKSAKAGGHILHVLF